MCFVFPGIAPTIDNLDNTIYVRETETAPKELYTVSQYNYDLP